MAKQTTVRKEKIRKEADSAALKSRAAASTAAARSAELDRTIHERTRLAIISALAVNDSLTFTELKALLDTSDGNLSVHARKLEEAEYIVCRKSFAGRLPRTEYKLTAAGRRALERYLNHMEALIHATRARRRPPGPRRKLLSAKISWHKLRKPRRDLRRLLSLRLARLPARAFFGLLTMWFTIPTDSGWMRSAARHLPCLSSSPNLNH